MKILGAAIGECVHVAGVYNFLRLAAEAKHETVFLGPAVDTTALIKALRETNPDVVGLSYRLSPDAAERLLTEVRAALVAAGEGHRRFVFGGTPPVARVARTAGWFEKVFDGTEGDEKVLAWLRAAVRPRDPLIHGQAVPSGAREEGRPEEPASLPPQSLVERIEAQKPYPLIRHHFGLPSLADTISGAAEIAEAGVLDVISLGPDQNAQESFFRPEEMDSSQDGAGGVPVRRPEDFRAIYEASRRGNYPLVRSYSGTRDLIKMAGMLKETINLAWGAIPLFWYSELDGRSTRRLEDTIAEAQQAMAWHARAGIPVEANEAHHWGLRDAPDAVVVAAGFLAAYNAMKVGVREYVAQFMFNTPAATSFRMDLAKMLAMLDLISVLEEAGRFRVWRQTRAGLASFPADLDMAKGQLASSTMLQMALKPHIVHVVAHCEADHAATPTDIIEAVKIARGVIKNAIHGLPDLTSDPVVQERRRDLAQEARAVLEGLQGLAPEGRDAWSDPEVLGRSVR
ncbi:MAG: cobalamin B12-binding domain-containing protein, partial [Firmicutes bacterium]|nr:cobalamin B12-binding domain-containing protein [Bacillota bacterium]